MSDVIEPADFATRIAVLLPALSIRALRELHQAIVAGVRDEDARPPSAPKQSDIRAHADFRIVADALEAELRRRGETVISVPW